VKRWRRETQDNSKRYREYRRLALIRLKELFEKRGGHCEKCSETDKSIIEIHHVKEINGNRTLRNWFYLLTIPEEDIQFLCANCHAKTQGRTGILNLS